MKLLNIIVEQMPTYPGGDAELMKFINSNIRYPDEAIARKIEGRVTLRFVINTEGKAEAITVVKGVNPLLDAEAVRVISMLNGWKPGMQGGKAINVWYSVPVIFSLSKQESVFTKTSMSDLYKFIYRNIQYPQEANNSSDTGRIFVVVKLNKGGITRECKAFTERNEIKVPVLDEVVITALRPNREKSSANSINAVSNEHPALKTECLRVANKLTVNEIPDWHDKDLEFALSFKFVLR